jgi:hypothetical protein
VLRPGGRLLDCREHVADDEHQLRRFRDAHPLHARAGGENAWPIDRYLAAFTGAGFRALRVFGPADAMLNFYPGPPSRRWAMKALLRLRALLGRPDRTPGRLYSFLLARD